MSEFVRIAATPHAHDILINYMVHGGGSVRDADRSILAIWQEIGEEHALLKAHLHALIEDCARLNGAEHRCECTADDTAGCADRALQHVGELLAYVVTHFSHEEKVMRQFNLPALNRPMYDEHVQEHARLSEGFSRLASAIDERNLLPHLKQLHDLMDRWLQKHILVNDNALLSAIGANRLD